jgi:hypothetical protein
VYRRLINLAINFITKQQVCSSSFAQVRERAPSFYLWLRSHTQQKVGSVSACLLQIVTGPSRINAYSFLAAPQTPIRRDPEASLPDMLNLCLASNKKRKKIREGGIRHKRERENNKL